MLDLFGLVQVIGAVAAAAVGYARGATLSRTLGGWQVIRTLGMRMTKLKPVHGFAAETAGAATLFMNTMLGIPVSTTHTKTTAIMGVGSARRLSTVNWGVVKDMLTAWVLTFPGCGLISFLMARLCMMIF